MWNSLHVQLPVPLPHLPASMVVSYPEEQLMHLCEEAADGVIVFAIVQQQEPGVAGCHIGSDKQVVEPVHCLHSSTQLQG